MRGVKSYHHGVRKNLDRGMVSNGTPVVSTQALMLSNRTLRHECESRIPRLWRLEDGWPHSSGPKQISKKNQQCTPRERISVKSAYESGLLFLSNIPPPGPTAAAVAQGGAGGPPQAPGGRSPPGPSVSDQFQTNPDFLVFTIDLPNFVYRVGFGTAMTLQTHLWTVECIDLLAF